MPFTPRPLITSLTLCLLGALLVVAPAAAVTASDTVAADPADNGAVVTVAPTAHPAVRGPRAVASLPGGIVVTGHDGRPVALFAEGQPVLRKPRPGRAPATFTGLRPGTRYTVMVGGSLVGRVTALDRPSAATGLVVRTTETSDAVSLTWKHRPTAATGGSAITYDLVAQSSSAPTATATVRGATTGRIEGLDPTALYAFTVTPRNSTGKGGATSARMSRSLAQITGTSPTPAPSPTPTGTPSPTPTPTAPAPVPVPAAPAPGPAAPGPAPAPAAPAPVYVCPDGYAESAGVCRQSIPYTYHSVTETAAYSYHPSFVETSRTYRDFGTDWSGTTCPYGGTMHDGHCLGWDIQGVTVQVKDNPPAGWLDDGTSYVRQVQVKDAMPAGYADDGTAWIRTTAKVAR